MQFIRSQKMNLTKYSVSNLYDPKMWMVFLIVWLFSVGSQSATMTSQLQMEANAILKSGWWNTSDAYFNISNLCKWDGIACNKDGSINLIIKYSSTTSEIHFATLNLSVFHNLEFLYVGGIGLQGTIPKEIGLLSKLTYLYLLNNSLVGEIPPSIGNLRQLEFLDISYNNLQGSIPHELGFIKNLTLLDLSNNRIKGEIPSSLGNLKQLEYVHISYNNIQGSIPHELGFLKNITTLDLSHNRLNGNFPISLTDLTQLQYLDISNNFLTGGLPSNFSQLSNLRILRLNNNSIGGTFPISFNTLSQLVFFNISNNLLNGTLPSNFIPMIDYKINIDLSHNHISGVIPSRLGNFQQLLLNNNNISGTIPQSICNVPFVNISYNYLRGPIPSCVSDPSAIIGNNDVCTNKLYDKTELKPCPSLYYTIIGKTKKVELHVVIVLPILVILIFAFSLIMCLKLHHTSIKNRQAKNSTKKNGDFFCIWNYDGQIAYDDIIRATEDFDIRYCIGTGAYGSVYKAQLPCGKVVALKKLHGYEAEVPSFDESFRNEVRILSEIKHRNIVKLYGFCLHKRIMFLIYQYMEKGSLFYVLYDEVEAVEFNWRKRVNVVKGVAFGLSYLHHDCTPAIVHRDVSTSNILLNSEWQPSVSDFGTARLLQYDSSNRTIVAGTIGYIAPGNSFFYYKPHVT